MSSKKKKAPPPNVKSSNAPTVADLTEQDIQVGSDIQMKTKKIEIAATLMRIHNEDEKESKDLITRSFKKQKHQQEENIQ